MRPRHAGHKKLGPQRGQSFLIIIMFVSLILLAILGVATDYTQIWAHRQMAQGAADAACQAAAANIYIATIAPGDLPTAGTSWIGTPFDCSSNTGSAPCQYASYNGYTGSAVNVTFPTAIGSFTTPSGFTIPYPFVRVTVTDPVPMSFTKLVSSTGTFNITARAGCGVQALSMPIPLLILNQTQAGTLSTSGSPTVQIIGGPNRSVQVDSKSTTAVSVGGSSTINLSQAGPSFTGSDFGLTGNEAKPAGVTLGSTGSWLSPDLPYGDPFATVAAPGVPSTVGAAYPVPLGVNGCPDPNGCVEFKAGSYVGCSTGTILPYGQGCVNLPYTGSNPKFSVAGLNFQPSHVYKVGDMIQPANGGGSGCGATVNSGGFLYMVTTAGTSGTCPAAASWSGTVCSKQANGTCVAGSSATTSGGATFQNVGKVISNLHLTTAIFDPGVYYVAANGVQFASGSTARTSTATGDGSGGVMFYLSTSTSVSITASAGSQAPCVTADALTNSSPNGCVVTYSVTGGTSSAGTGTVPSRAAQCPGGPANPSQVPAAVDGNILLGPCSGTYGGTGSVNRGFLFFQNRATAANGGSCPGGGGQCAILGGGAGFIFSGYLYFHEGNGSSCGSTTSCLAMAGGSGANSFTLGDIAVDELSLNGSSAIKMILNPATNFPLLSPQLLE